MSKTVIVQGTEIPRIGLGTWKLVGDTCFRAVRTALELGYRHVDTAAAYENEEVVGRALAAAHVDREDVFLVTKIPPSDLRSGALGLSLRDSLRKLDTDYVDLALVHWPNPEVSLSETLTALELAREQGLCHHFGISNFPPALVRRTLAESRPLALQVELHPMLDQTELLRLCRDHDLLFTAYSPLYGGRLLDDPVLTDIAEAHGATVAQVALAWILRAPNVAAIPRSTRVEHLRDNLAATDLELTDDDVRRIDALPKDRRLVNPPWAPRWEAPPEPRPLA
jgi:2,5-diketo-D-gluconate reductase B